MAWKKILNYLAIAALLLTLVGNLPTNKALASVPDKNAVANGSFEAGSGAAATGWALGTNYTRASDNPHDAAYSLKSTATSTSVSSRSVAVLANTTYKLSVWIYKTNNNGVAYVDMNDMAGEAQIGVSVGAGGGVWTYSEATWFTGSTTSITLRTVVDSSPTSSIWFDDIRLVPVSTSPNTVANPSFETGSGSAATGWTLGTGYARASDKSYDGDYSLKSTATSTSVSSRTVAVIAHTSYKLSVWIYKNNNNGVAYVDMNDVAGEAQIGVSVGSGGGAWTYSEAIWNSGTTTSITLRTVVDSSPTDAIWFDDIQMTPQWNLNTSDTYLTLKVADNRPAISLLKNPTQNWNWTPADTAIPLTNRIDIGGTQYTPNWTYQDAAVDTSSGTKVSLRFTSSTPNVELKSIWWARPGSGPVEHWMTIENKTGSVITVYQQESLQMDVKGSSNPTLWRFHKESGQPDSSGIYKTNLTNSNNITADTNASNDWNASGYIPLVFLDSASSHGLYVGWEWPHGRIQTTTSASGSPSVITVKAGLNTDFKTDIKVNGFYDIPSVYIGAYYGDTDAGSNVFKKWFLANKAPVKTRTDTNEPYAQSAEMLMGLNYNLASWGVNAIQWDYGWWPGTAEGDWRLGNANYIAAVNALGGTTWGDYGTYNQTKGLSYTNYFLLHDGNSSDPNALSSTGPNAHADWFSNRLITNGYSADLGNDSAVSWIQSHLLSVMNANKIDTYRSDFEPIAITSSQTNNHKYTTDVQYWNAKGFYNILDYLYTNKSGFRYENNGSGGSLKDFATMKRSSVIVYSDTATADAQRETFYTTSYGIHPAQMLSATNVDGFTNNTDDDYGWRSIILSGMMIASSSVSGGHLPNSGDTYMQKYFGMFRDKIRPLVRNANLYHILPRPDGVHWDGVEYFDPTVTGAGAIKGAVFLFKPGNTEGNTKTIYFKGLNPTSYYSLVFEDRTAQNTSTPVLGSTLMAGLSVSITQTKSSEIIWIK